MRRAALPAFLVLLAACASGPSTRATAARSRRATADAGPRATPDAPPAPSVPNAVVVWSQRVSSDVAPIAIDGGDVIAADGARASRIDGRTGSLRWTFDAGEQGRVVEISVGDDAVGITTQLGNRGFEGVWVDRTSGSVRWRRAIQPSSRLRAGALGSGATLAWPCAIEPLDPASGTTRAARIEGVEVALPDPGATACANAPRLLADAGGRALVVHAPRTDRVEIATVDLQHGVDAPRGSVALPRPIRTASLRALGRGGAFAAQVTETEWLVLAVDPAQPSVRWSHRVGGERDCRPSALASPVRLVAHDGRDAILAQICRSAVLIAADDGRELWTRGLGDDLAGFAGERTARFWDAAALPPMGPRRVAWLGHDGAPGETLSLPEDGAAELVDGALLVLRDDRARLVSSDETTQWEASDVSGRVLATLPASDSSLPIVILVAPDGARVSAVAMGFPS